MDVSLVPGVWLVLPEKYVIRALPLDNSRKVSAMNERQLEIASHAVSEFVQSAAYGSDAVKGEELKALAVSVAEAIVAGFEKLGVVS